MFDEPLFWVWAVPAVVIFLILGMIVLWAALVNSQSESNLGLGAWYGFITLAGGVPVIALVASVWPLWFPFAFALDIQEKRQEKKQANPFK